MRKTDVHLGHYYMYLRKSHADVEKERIGKFETLERHYQELAYYCEREGYPVDGMFRELVSGESIADRHEFQKLMDLVSQRKVTGIVVHAVDRLGRGDMMEYGWVLSTLQYTGTLIITPGKVYDPTDTADFLALQMLMIISNGEYNNIKERFRRGKEASVRSGQYIASRPCYGYDKVDVDRMHTAKPNDKAEVVERIFHLVASGKSPWEVAKELNEAKIPSCDGKLWSYRVVKRLIRNPFYKGYVRFGLRRVTVDYREGFAKKKVRRASDDFMLEKGLHEPIVSEELWQRANDSIVPGERAREDRPLANALAGMLVCSKCGKRVRSGNDKRGNRRYYHESFTGCTGWKSCRADVVLDMVASSLADALGDVEATVDRGADMIAQRDAEVSALTKERDSLLRRADRLVELYMAEPPAISITEFRNRKQVIDGNLEEVEAKLAEISSRKMPDFEMITMSLREAMGTLSDDGIPAEHKNAMLKRIIKRIEMENRSTENGKNDIHLSIFLRDE